MSSAEFWSLPVWEFRLLSKQINAIEAERRLAILDMTSMGFNGYGKGSDGRARERYVTQLRNTAYGRERRRKTNLIEMEQKRQEKLAQGLSVEEAEEAVNPLFAFFAAEFGAG